MKSAALTAVWAAGGRNWHERCDSSPGRSTSRGVMLEPADLELIHVTKRYGAATAVDAIDLKVPAGSYCCLLGPSGCGKTSTLRMIAGHESATEGDILLGSVNVTEL